MSLDCISPRVVCINKSNKQLIIIYKEITTYEAIRPFFSTDLNESMASCTEQIPSSAIGIPNPLLQFFLEF